MSGNIVPLLLCPMRQAPPLEASHWLQCYCHNIAEHLRTTARILTLSLLVSGEHRKRRSLPKPSRHVKAETVVRVYRLVRLRRACGGRNGKGREGRES
jgi:hypothetical protein